MNPSNLPDFLAYWRDEGEAYARRGDYAWMAAQVPVGPVLEIGCGLGFGTAALRARGFSVLAMDSLPECLSATQAHLGESAVDLLPADVTSLSDAARQQLAAFAPLTVVCWLMGASAETTGAHAQDGGVGVAAYRDAVHRAVAELAVNLSSVRFLHLVDRTAIPWQAKDLGRDTLVHYHSARTLAGLPFHTERRLALYRKLEGNVVDLAKLRQAHAALKSVTPVLASLLAERKSSS